jgi:predicted transcriptional regulator of viral defense system
MQKLTEQLIARLQKPFFTRTELDVWTGGSVYRRDALLRRAMAAGEVMRIRRGLYVLCPPFGSQKPNPLVLAQQVYGPSYLSMESALSFHGWIPEAVYSVASVSLNRSRVFDTPAGRFEYVRVSQRTFFAGVDRIETSPAGDAVLMASPLKALSDLVYVRRCDDAPSALLESLRIEPGFTASVTAKQIDDLSGNYSVVRVQRFLDAMKERVTA